MILSINFYFFYIIFKILNCSLITQIAFGICFYSDSEKKMTAIEFMPII